MGSEKPRDEAAERAFLEADSRAALMSSFMQARRVMFDAGREFARAGYNAENFRAARAEATLAMIEGTLRDPGSEQQKEADRILGVVHQRAGEGEARGLVVQWAVPSEVEIGEKVLDTSLNEFRRVTGVRPYKLGYEIAYEGDEQEWRLVDQDMLLVVVCQRAGEGEGAASEPEIEVSRLLLQVATERERTAQAERARREAIDERNSAENALDAALSAQRAGEGEAARERVAEVLYRLRGYDKEPGRTVAWSEARGPRRQARLEDADAVLAALSAQRAGGPAEAAHTQSHATGGNLPVVGGGASSTSYILVVPESDAREQAALRSAVEGRRVLGRPIHVMFLPTDALARLGEDFRRLEEQPGIEPFKQRIIDEDEQLRDRVEKLRLFVHPANDHFMDLPDAERMRLYQQLDAMSAYQAVLTERREALGIAR